VPPALLILAAASAWAEWAKVSEAGDTVFYVDPASIVDQGGFRRVSVTEDFASRDPGVARSRRVLYEIDCALERLRSLSITEYSDPMGQGNDMGSWEGESGWLPVAALTGSNLPPRTPYRQIVRFVCSR
jgi:hypothetical protein